MQIEYFEYCKGGESTNSLPLFFSVFFAKNQEYNKERNKLN